MEGEKVSKAQRQVISKIKDENEALKQRLARESRFSRLSQSMSSSGDIIKLQEDANSYLRRIELEKRQIAKLDSEIASCQATIIEQRKKMGGINASKETHDMISRQIRLYENRLDKCLVKFNESLAKNKSLREEIDSLRRERVVCDGIYKKLERELHEKKKEMAAIIEDSKNAYQTRDKAQSEMLALKQQADRDQADFDKEWEHLGRIMEQDKQLRESLNRQKVESKATIHQTSTSDPNHTEVQEDDSQYPWSDTKPESTSALSSERIQSFEEAFHKIQEGTGVRDVHELVERFLQAEDKNFRLFNFVNSLNSEIERLELMIADTKGEIEKYKGQGVSTDTQRKKVLRDLEEKLSRTEARATEYDTKYTAANKTIAQLKQGIQSIFTRLGPSRRSEASTATTTQSMDERASVEEMLGNQGVTESNMMQYLGIIEQRTSEILHLYYESQQDDGEAAARELVPGEGILQPGAPKLYVMPPAWEEFSSGEESDHEDDERPLTRDELHRKTLRGLGKREIKPGGKVRPFKSK